VQQEADIPPIPNHDLSRQDSPDTNGLDEQPPDEPNDISAEISEDELTDIPLPKRPRSPVPVETAQDVSKRARTYEQCFAPTKAGTTVVPVYLVDQSRKRTVIVDVHEGLRMPAMREAMDREVASFRAMKCIETVPMQNVSRGSNLVTTRWVFTIKTKEDGTKRYKARLVARGFEDDERDKVTRDSPTAANSSQRLVLQVLAERQWTPTSWDFETAFLQGKPIERAVYIAAPPGYAPADACWRLRKPVWLGLGPKSLV
jgi:Reverse transcriptase (RNA-dependent DNA polymerase)